MDKWVAPQLHRRTHGSQVRGLYVAIHIGIDVLRGSAWVCQPTVSGLQTWESLLVDEEPFLLVGGNSADSPHPLRRDKTTHNKQTHKTKPSGIPNRETIWTQTP